MNATRIETGTGIRRTTHAQPRRAPHTCDVEISRTAEAGRRTRFRTNFTRTRRQHPAQTGNTRPLLRDQCCTPRNRSARWGGVGGCPPVRWHRRTGGPLRGNLMNKTRGALAPFDWLSRLASEGHGGSLGPSAGEYHRYPDRVEVRKRRVGLSEHPWIQFWRMNLDHSWGDWAFRCDSKRAEDRLPPRHPSCSSLTRGVQRPGGEVENT